MQLEVPNLFFFFMETKLNLKEAELIKLLDIGMTNGIITECDSSKRGRKAGLYLFWFNFFAIVSMVIFSELY